MTINLFFTNYNSSKSKQFFLHDQISAVIFWKKYTQIRIKAKIERTSPQYNKDYFLTRSGKNAPISSNQSKQIESFDMVKENFKQVLNNKIFMIALIIGGVRIWAIWNRILEREIKIRANRRDLFTMSNSKWTYNTLEPWNCLKKIFFVIELLPIIHK